MNKTQLVQKVAEQTELTQAQAGAAVTAVTNVVTEALKNGEKVQIAGFGMFEPRVRAARTGRNPHTHEPMEIPEITVPAFKAGSALKEAVRG